MPFQISLDEKNVIVDKCKNYLCKNFAISALSVSFGTYRLYNKHCTISIANDACMTQETGQATS